MSCDDVLVSTWHRVSRALEAADAASRTDSSNLTHADLISTLEGVLYDLVELRCANKTLLRQVMRAGRPDLVEKMLSHHGVEPFRDIQTDPDRVITFHDHLISGDLDLLRPLTDAGIPIAELPPSESLAAALATKAPGKSLAFAVHNAGMEKHLLPRLVFTLIQNADPSRAQVLADILRDLPTPLAQESWCEIADRVFLLFRMKAAAALLLSGLNVAEIYPSFATATLPKPIRDLFTLTESAHGRMQLAAREPSLADVLQRSGDSGRFFGITQSEAEEMFRSQRA